MSFQIALSALQAINGQLDSISQNIANTGTTGYKSSRTNFGAMYANTAPNGVQAVSQTQTLDVEGGLLSTGRNLDVAISGRGYFVVTDGTGMTNYTRNGIFDVNAQGFLVDHMGRRVQGYAMTPGSDALGSMGDLTVPTGQIAARPSTKLEFVGNLSADWTVPTAAFNMNNPATYNSSTVSVVYDSLGRQHTVTQYFAKTATGVNVHYSVDGAATTGPNAMTFDTQGQITAGGTHTLNITFTPPDADPINLAIDYTGTTQFAGDTNTSTNAADGYASGTMVNVKVGEDGSLNVQYSNGKTQRVGKIALASFRSESGLMPVDGTSWQATHESGVALIGEPGSGQFGALAAKQLESSNVEVASQLVDLMGAQRNYQANTKVINTQNEIMQSLLQVM